MKKEEQFEILLEKVKQLSPENQKAIVFLIENFDLVKKMCENSGKTDEEIQKRLAIAPFSRLLRLHSSPLFVTHPTLHDGYFHSTGFVTFQIVDEYFVCLQTSLEYPHRQDTYCNFPIVANQRTSLA